MLTAIAIIARVFLIPDVSDIFVTVSVPWLQCIQII
jgi:hypothetical protein